MTYGFRCRNCGHLVDSAHAGVRATPRKCPVCRAGVAFDEGGVAHDRPDNWEVLADASPERLAELGIGPDQVCRHAPCADGDREANLERCRADLASMTAKEAAWKARPLEAWQDDLDALHERLNALAADAPADDSDHAAYAAWEHAKEALRQEIEALLAREWTERDAARKHDLEGVILKGGAVARSGVRKVAVVARERRKFGDQA